MFMQLIDVKRANLSNIPKVVVRKWRTLFFNPVGVYHKYKGKLKAKFVKLLGGIPPIYNEDYDTHWNFTSFKDKSILDLGADYGSTAYYFLRRGANKVIAVEGDSQLASKLKLHFQNDDKVITIKDFIDSPKKIEKLISEHHPSLIKVDIEGNEKNILGINNIKQVNEWLIEAHSNELYHALSTFLTEQDFHVRSFNYVDNLKIIHASKIV